MRHPFTSLLPVAALAGAWGQAHAQPSPEEATAIEAPLPRGLSDEDLARLAAGEAIEIFDERPDKPFDRDTEVRLTGEEIVARGATDLRSALALIPELNVRDIGRGGFQVDIRGARKGAVSIMIDGVVVSDPWYGTFDVSTIPVTDIVQIRVATTPQSPIDGPGGPGGVIEVHTRDAIGAQRVILRATADSLPSLGATAMARVALGRHVGLRISGSGLAGARDLALPNQAILDEQRRASTGAARLEYRAGTRRLAADGFIDDRHYIAPPSDVQTSSILVIDRETTARGSIRLDEQRGKLQLQGLYFVNYLKRRSRYFLDPGFARQQQSEDLSAIRSGGMALATRPITKDLRWAASAQATHEKALVFNMASDYVRGDVTLVELAGDLQYEHDRLRLDAALGLATPFGVGASPWPEGKLVARYKLRPATELTATTGYKGRVPSLRERFDAAIGNPALGPEKAAHAEVRVVEARDRLRLEVAPFYRRTTGFVRTAVEGPEMGRLVNLGELDFYGVDVLGRGMVHPRVEVGGSYNYVRVTMDSAATAQQQEEPLDHLPHHRFDAFARLIASTRLSGVVRVRFYGEAIDRMRTVGAYALLEGNLTWQLTDDYLGVLRIDDALDVRPETRSGYHAPGRVISLVLQGSWR